MSDRHAELRAEDPHGRRSSYEIEAQVEGEDIYADIEVAGDINELKDAVLRMARHLGLGGN